MSLQPGPGKSFGANSVNSPIRAKSLQKGANSKVLKTGRTLIIQSGSLEGMAADAKRRVFTNAKQGLSVRTTEKESPMNSA